MKKEISYLDTLKCLINYSSIQPICKSVDEKVHLIDTEKFIDIIAQKIDI